ncbi:hypothetical protein ACFSHQ_23205 [Gemmobacter lanyuensis]
MIAQGLDVCGWIGRRIDGCKEAGHRLVGAAAAGFIVTETLAAGKGPAAPARQLGTVHLDCADLGAAILITRPQDADSLHSQHPAFPQKPSAATFHKLHRISGLATRRAEAEGLHLLACRDIRAETGRKTKLNHHLPPG